MIKPWKDRVEAAAHFREEDYINDVQYFMQAEIEELRTENARLKANIETRKSNYNRLKAMVDDRSISGRTFSLCEELEKENARLKSALLTNDTTIESANNAAGMLEAENARLRAEVDQWKVDFTEVLTDTKRLRAALTTARTALIEHGSAYLHHELRYQEALDAARAALGEKS